MFTLKNAAAVACVLAMSGCLAAEGQSYYQDTGYQNTSASPSSRAPRTYTPPPTRAYVPPTYRAPSYEPYRGAGSNLMTGTRRSRGAGTSLLR